MSDAFNRRTALHCLAFGGAGTLFTLSGGIVTPVALGAPYAATGTPLFLQISDTHIGFNKEANPDVAGTLNQTIALVNAMPVAPALTLHTGDITHLSRAAEFDTAMQLMGGLKAGELHTTPGEHDVTDGTGSEYFARFGKASAGRGYYSFDHQGVHFVALVNVMHFQAGGLGAFGEDQLAWLKDDLAARTSSTPVVVFAHMPMWTIQESWGWGTADAEVALGYLRRFGSVTILNGHIHQIVQKVEGNITFHTARSTAYPQPAPGVGTGPGPLKVAPSELPGMLGMTSITLKRHHLSLADTTLV
ncbi:MAG: metallophosphoesterase [Alphaproteobacteria bacterium]|nr:metallophosphoesterase [Alphaproteobacteria bacterium]